MPEWKEEIRRRLASLKLEPAREAEIVEELSQHMDDRYAELLAGGATRYEAEGRTLAEVRESDSLQRELKRVERQAVQEPIIFGTNRRRNMVIDLWQDARYGARMLIKQPGFTLIAILTLALGIGANTAIFSIINAVVFRPRPVAQPEQLVEFYKSDARHRYQNNAYQDFLIFRDQGEAFTGLAAYSLRTFKLGGADEMEQVIGEMVSGNYFDLLGVKALNGRTFLPEEDQTPGSHPVAVISHGLWSRRFGADPGLIGKTITINNQALTVIGVAPPQYTGMIRGLATELWVPVMMVPQLEPQSGMSMLNSRGNSWLFIVGRLKPEATLEQARARFDLIASQLREAYPEDWRERRPESGVTLDRSITILPESETRIHPEAHTAAYAFIALALTIINLVMLIACMNLANLLLARSTARSKEIAVRLALGAARWRIVRQMLTESVLLAALGGALGVLLAVWVINAVVASLPALPEGIRVAIDLRLDWRVLLYTLVFSFLVGVLFGLAPALQASRPNVIAALKEGADVFSGTRGQSRLRNGLIIAQVALSVVLLAGAGLVMRSVRNLNPINLGFDSLNLVVAPVKLEERLYDRARSQEFYRRLAELARALPGARAVTFVDFTPGMGRSRGTVGIEGYQPVPGEDLELDRNIIGPGYLTAMNIPITQGRDFGERDRDGAPCVAVVNEALARRYFADGRALGKHLIKSVWKQPDQPCEIVGVVRDNKFQSLRKEPLPWYAFPLLQSNRTQTTLLVHSEGAPENLVPAVRRAIQSLDKTIVTTDVLTLNDTFGPVLYFYRLFGLLVGACGLLAISLAVIGIYGVVAYAVSRRAREIGIRMALGADRQKVLRLVMRQGMILVAYGLGSGLLLALALTQVLTSSIFEIPLLNGVSATDPLTFGSITLLLVVAALLACYVPARRATTVDPMVALRCE
ncbi:MAG TPA: ABC transporter permease [Blastocatellia bacterium]|nr:ABC transporter permease [Blastocatellia bacterium]